MSVRDLVIIGAGPSGLAAAIAAKKHGLDYQVLEQGVLVNSIYRFPPQMVFFTTPELLEIGGLPFVSPYEKPTRAEALRYYRKVVDTYDLQIAFGEQVLGFAEAPAAMLGDGPSSLSKASASERAGGGARRHWKRRRRSSASKPDRHAAFAACATRATSSSRSATTIIR